MLLEIKTARPDLTFHQFRTLVIQCDACSNTFTHKYKKTYAEKQRHFCDRRCSNVGKKINKDVERVRHLTCFACQMPFDTVCNTNQSNPRTCSRSCASSLTARELNLVLHMQVPEVRAQAMKTRSEHWRDGTVVHGMKGKHFTCSEERKAILREKNSGENNAFFGKKHTEETKQKMRDVRSKLIIEGRMNWAIFGHKSGTHSSPKIGGSVHFRSSWEEATMIWLDASSDVAAWDYECVRIPYQYDNHKRWYVPDFLVTFQDGHKELWEVKPREFVESEKVQLKSKAAKEYCQQAGITEYRILAKSELILKGII